MAAVAGTDVPAGHAVLSGGFERRLFTATATASDTVTLAAYFDAIYYVRAWDVSDGTDAEAFVTGSAYGSGITLTQNKGAIYIEVIGRPKKVTRGAT